MGQRTAAGCEALCGLALVSGGASLLWPFQAWALVNTIRSTIRNPRLKLPPRCPLLTPRSESKTEVRSAVGAVVGAPVGENVGEWVSPSFVGVAVGASVGGAGVGQATAGIELGSVRRMRRKLCRQLR